MNQQSQLSSTSSLTDIGALRVAVVSASWHKSIINNAVTAIEGEFAREGFTSSLTRFEVPGAFEIPVMTQ